MKLSEVRERVQAHYFDFVEIRKNPANISEYISLLYALDGKSCMLCYENGAVISSDELEHLVLMLKEVGFRKAKIYF